MQEDKLKEAIVEALNICCVTTSDELFIEQALELQKHMMDGAKNGHFGETSRDHINAIEEIKSSAPPLSDDGKRGALLFSLETMKGFHKATVAHFPHVYAHSDFGKRFPDMGLRQFVQKSSRGNPMSVMDTLMAMNALSLIMSTLKMDVKRLGLSGDVIKEVEASKEKTIRLFEAVGCLFLSRIALMEAFPNLSPSQRLEAFAMHTVPHTTLVGALKAMATIPEKTLSRSTTVFDGLMALAIDRVATSMARMHEADRAEAEKL